MFSPTFRSPTPPLSIRTWVRKGAGLFFRARSYGAACWGSSNGSSFSFSTRHLTFGGDGAHFWHRSKSRGRSTDLHVSKLFMCRTLSVSQAKEEKTVFSLSLSTSTHSPFAHPTSSSAGRGTLQERIALAATH